MIHSRPESRRRATRSGLAIAIFLTAFLLTGFTVDWLQARDGTYSYLKLFNEILLLVRNSYVEEVEAGDLMRGAYDGLLGTLDPQSEYLTREQYDRLTGTPPADEGDVGLDLSRRSGYLYVVSVLPGSTADEAGLRGGTRLRRIAKRSTRELTLTEAQLMLRGPVGTEVLVQRFPGGGDPEEVVLVRRRPQEPHPWLRHTGGAAVLRIDALRSGTAADASEALQEMDGVETLLLDLRGVSLGDYDEAARVASLFVAGGDVGIIRSRGGEERVLRARKKDIRAAGGRLAVLVDGGTAGPAELLAQALRLRAGAPVLGAKTFGRGTLQDFIPVNDGGYLRLSVARCLDSEGQAWDGAGLMPDHLLEADDDDHEAWIARALQILAPPAAAERPAA